MEGQTPSPNSKGQQTTVFISYAREDSDSARRLYEDLKDEGLTPWLDKKELLPGQNWENEIEDAISKSRYFIPLFSKTSVKKIGYVQGEFKFALEVFRRYPPNVIFYIPVRLDDCEIPYKELKPIHHADLFPVDDDNIWKEGVKQILRAIAITSQYDKKDRNHNSINQSTRQPSTSDRKENDIFSVQNIRSSQKLKNIVRFRSEKQTFVGRQEYIDEIKEYFKVRGTHLSIWGPGGSGKSQLAFKAIHQCEEHGIFDLVIPVYFDIGLITFNEFLSLLAKSSDVGISIQDFEKQNIEERKGIISNLLDQKEHPLIFVDSYETISSVLNNSAVTNPSDELVQINYFLNNNLPPNTSILLTSREKNNLDVETRLELKGLKEEEGKKLFTTLVREDYLKKPTGTVHSTIDALLKKTGGHPLSIEIIAKNITSIDEVEEVSQSLGVREVNRGEPNERLKSLKNSFDYTINKLGKQLQDLLFQLTFFKSPFPISAPVEIFGIDKHNITELYNRSLLTRIESDEEYGKIENPEYWLYNLHPATRNYLEDTFKISSNFENEYGEKFSKYYYDLLQDTFDALNNETRILSLRRFNIIIQAEYNDFDRSTNLTKDKCMTANMCRTLGLILSTIAIPTKALRLHSRSLQIHQNLDDKIGIAEDYTNIGSVLEDMGSYKEALDYHNKAKTIHEEIKDKTEMAKDYRNIGITLEDMGSYKEALEYYHKARSIHEEIKDKTEMAKDYTNIGIALVDMGRYQEGLDYHNKALEIDKELNDKVGMAKDYKNIGVAFYYMNNFREALEYHNKALEIDKELNDKVGMAKDYTNIGIVLYKTDNFREALEYHNKALEIDKQLNDKVGMARDWGDIGLVLSRTGELKEALEYHNKALEIDKQLNDEIRIAEDYNNIGDVLHSMGDNKRARESLFNALAILQALEKETKFHYPLIENVQAQLSSLPTDI